MAEEMTGAFRAGLRQFVPAVSAEEEARLLASFALYRRELLDWNTRTNLTAITDPEEVLLKHFLDSLSLLQAYDEPVVRLLDIGTGAGFPGLPLKMLRPQWQVTLLEATGKKTLFLRHMVEVLQLSAVEIIHGRAEEYAHKSRYRAHFDLVTARAVSSLPVLLEVCAPFCRVGGQIVLPRKGDLEQELPSGKRAAGQVGAHFRAAVPVTIPGLDDGRSLLAWQQQKVCPAQYPRSWAAMTKKPLG